MKSHNIGGVCGLAVILAGCGSTAEMKTSYAAAWVGKPLDAFALKHGIPQARQPMADGRTMVEWKDTHGIGRGGVFADALISSAGGAQTQGNSYQLTCAVRMIVDKAGRIQDFVVTTDTIGAWQTSRCAEIFTSS